MTLEELKTRPLELNRSHVSSLAAPDNLPQLREFLADSNIDVAEAAARLIAVIGDPEAVDDLVHFGRKWASEDILKALLECGPRGRQRLADLCLEKHEVRGSAWSALLEGLKRPSIRPAIFGHVQAFLDNPQAPEGLRKGALQTLFMFGWASSCASLSESIGGNLILDWLETGVPPLFPATQTAVEDIPGPCLGAVRCKIADQIENSGLRSQALAELLEQELDRRAQVPVPTRAETGRNDPCPCGSGKKYKKCCLDSHQQAQRLDPWVTALRQSEWVPFGLLQLPMHYAEAERLLQILLETKPARLRVKKGDSPVVAWVIASRLMQWGDWTYGLEALRSALQEPEPPGLDVEAILGSVFVGISRDTGRASVAPLADLFISHGRESHLSLVGEFFSQDSDQLLSILDGLVSRHLPMSYLLALTDTALRRGADWSVGEELCEVLQALYPDEPDTAMALHELHEWADQERRDQPFPSPHPELLRLRSTLDRLACLPSLQLPGLEALLLRISELSLWPDADVAVTPDSETPLRAELEFRRQLQGKALEDLQLRLPELHAWALAQLHSSDQLCIALTLEELIWILPASFSLHNACLSAAAAGTLAAEMGLESPRVFAWQGRIGLRQAYQQANPNDLPLGVSVSLSEWAAPEIPPPFFLPLGCPPTDPEFPPLGSEDDPLIVRARRADQHVLEHAAVGAATGRFHPVDLAVAPSWQPRPALMVTPPPSVGLPIDLENDPIPARKALRKVLQRLFRLHKVGEAHTAVEMVARGVRGHLRGQVREAVQILLQRNILRDKPTLKGPHTSIEPKQVPAVLRFIEQGWLPHEDLGPVLES